MSVVHERHIGFVVSLAEDARRVESDSPPAQVRRAQPDRGGRHVLEEITAPFGTRYGHNVVALVQQPGDGNLPRRRPVGESDFPHNIRRLDISVEVRALKARVVPTIIVLRIFLRAFDTAGKQAAPQRGEWHESDAQVPQYGDDSRLQMALPK